MWEDKPTQAEWCDAIDVFEWYVRYLREHEPGAHITISALENILNDLPLTLDEE